MPRRKPIARPADTNAHALLEVRVVPRAGRSGIAVLAEAFGLPKRSIEIVSGERSRSKRVRVAGMDRDSALTVLGTLESRFHDRVKDHID